MEYTYDEFKYFLEIGMEYLVYYNGKRYNISQRRDLGEIYFTLSPSDYYTFTSCEELLNAPLLDGKTLLEQWNFLNIIG
ncbi:hypothetical protein BVE84_02375 [Streptococcus azizii]|uniref:Uncharacterized protein n=1 Tax=Streptococcus azizii TaxID=1579424 RepID=A0AB36JS16_9STRE|nr:hypothetical protein BVE86_01065 [Streptococcus azizii]ONK29656.1 hypothetical protein BVE85_02375 [Streptococcus azizii]ONK30594.1 hypothetical protein BVE84_02375 [Streptococcus azizii]